MYIILKLDYTEKGGTIENRFPLQELNVGLKVVLHFLRCKITIVV